MLGKIRGEEEETKNESSNSMSTKRANGGGTDSLATENLDKVFDPSSVAVIGASKRKGSVGYTLMENLTNYGKREVYPITSKSDRVLGCKTYSHILDVPKTIDLGIITTKASKVPNIVRDCGEAGIPALIITSSGFRENDPQGNKWEEKIQQLRQRYGMRILGPNSSGVISPSTNLNASSFDQMPHEGDIAFISQSATLAASTLDWAIATQFGFSGFISVGDMIDIDFSDLIDYLGRDPSTDSILLYIEFLREAEHFMSAARGFARTNPIIAVKPGRFMKRNSSIASSQKGLRREDQIYEAAFKRTGIVRVDTLNDLFSCSETLARSNPPDGPRLAIVSNTGGAGILAMDKLIEKKGQLASLTKETKRHLQENLPAHASTSNPVNLTGKITPKQYKSAVKACIDDETVDGILCIYVPLGQISPEETAKAISSLSKGKKPILACWMGGKKVEKGREILREHNFPVQTTPEQSVRNFLYLNQYARNLERLLETPEELSMEERPSKYREKVKNLLEKVAREGRERLTEYESKEVLSLYGILSSTIRVARTPEQAKESASDLGFPVILKVHSPDITDIKVAGSLSVAVHSKDAVERQFKAITANASNNHPDAQIEGVTIQKMIIDPKLELFLGSKKDPLFGTVLTFGRGGASLEYIQDVSVGFPPLNQTLARMLMEETTIFNELKNTKEITANDFLTLEKYLVSLSQLIIDCPEITEVTINPLTQADGDFVAIDARIHIDKELALEAPEPKAHLVIEPYPRKYVEEWELDDGRKVLLRPIRPEDEPLEFELFETFSDQTWHHRFFGPMRDVTHDDMVRYTNIDYRREMAIIGVLEEEDKKKMIGVSRLIMDPELEEGEFAVVIGDPWQRLGLGEKLTRKIIEVAKDKGIEKVYGIVLRENRPMINLCKKLGFETEVESRTTLKVILHLNSS